MKRSKMSRRSNKTTFRKGTATHNKNISMAPNRGGWRL